ncbi:hypothetical protein VFPPC_10451 [Pochonia chlamydosporia 170]|uniref:Uncharacterized protein n=1 Tax=Pochonia chlamydosporia 170 TaxID=1380566 RepID=A0A179F1T3_METCM|nr:hypothetical protein VFPPC_10451 [Pochonia chlamydosporia 170]OAQ59392.1 hypothetical protein VFPPC_10451 [Pochonia chlamydosporia 170]
MKGFVSLLAVFSHVWAGSSAAGDGNFTVAFFPHSQSDSCNANDISKAITLTTSTRPNAYTCFNMSDIFTRNSSTGFQKTTNQQYGNRTGDPLNPNGISWLLHNQNLYDPKANYSHTWLKLADGSGAQEGKRSHWNFYQYTLPNCEQIRLGDETHGADTPWSMISCQTSEDGLCKTTPYPIGSFAIYNSGDPDSDKGKCRNWVQYGTAVRKGANVRSPVVAICWLVVFVLYW